MARTRPPYLQRLTTRHGSIAWYFHKRPGKKIRIHGQYGTPEFMAAYHAAAAGVALPPPRRASDGSLEAAIDGYKESQGWRILSPATKKQRDNIFKRIVAKTGGVGLDQIDRRMIAETRDGMSGLGAAKHFVQTMRGLFQWAVETGLVDADPTDGVKVARPKTDGFPEWTDGDMAAYESKWPIGTRERLWFAILLHTGMRRGDAVLFGPKHIKNGEIEFQTGKTGTAVIIPLADELREIIEASPTGKDTFIATVHGTPMTKEFFGNLFKEACVAAGVEATAHGLRKTAAMKLAYAGASVPELNSVFGWTGAKQALLYTEKASRARLARQAFARRK